MRAARHPRGAVAVAVETSMCCWTCPSDRWTCFPLLLRHPPPPDFAGAVVVGGAGGGAVEAVSVGGGEAGGVVGGDVLSGLLPDVEDSDGGARKKKSKNKLQATAGLAPVPAASPPSGRSGNNISSDSDSDFGFGDGGFSRRVEQRDQQDDDYPTGMLGSDEEANLAPSADEELFCPVCGTLRHVAPVTDSPEFHEALRYTAVDLGLGGTGDDARDASSSAPAAKVQHGPGTVGTAGNHLLRLCAGDAQDIERVVVFARHCPDDFSEVVRRCRQDADSHIRVIAELSGRPFEEHRTVLDRLRRLQLLSALLESLDDADGYARILLDFRGPVWIMLALSTPEEPSGLVLPRTPALDDGSAESSSDRRGTLARAHFQKLRCEALSLFGLGVALAPEIPRVRSMLDDEIFICGIVDIGVEHAFDLEGLVLDSVVRVLIALVTRLRPVRPPGGAAAIDPPTLVARTLFDTPEAHELGSGLVSHLNRSSVDVPLLFHGIVRLLQDIFASGETSDFFHTSDFLVLVDVILRNLRNIDAGHDHAVLEVLILLHYIVLNHPKFSQTQPRREDFALVLRELRQIYEDKEPGGEAHPSSVLAALKALLHDAPFLTA